MPLFGVVALAVAIWPAASREQHRVGWGAPGHVQRPPPPP